MDEETKKLFDLLYEKVDKEARTINLKIDSMNSAIDKLAQLCIATYNWLLAPKITEALQFQQKETPKQKKDDVSNVV